MSKTKASGQKNPSREVVHDGGAWYIEARQYNGRKFYNIRVRNNPLKGPLEIIKHNLEDIKRAVKSLDGPATYLYGRGGKIRLMVTPDGMVFIATEWLPVDVVKSILAEL